MDFTQRLALSYYKEIATLSDTHNVYLVQHLDTKKLYVKKILDIYDESVYNHLVSAPVDGTPKIYEVLKDQNTLYIIEEYILGETLQDMIEKGSLTSDLIIHYTSQLCHILSHLHQMDPPMIHRDIKPSNLIVTDSGKLVLIDFNAAKYVHPDKTADTVLLGTNGYAAPEQYGFAASTPQTDIYSLGILLKNMCESLDHYPAYLNAIIKKCTPMVPEKRYKDVSQISRDLKYSIFHLHAGSVLPLVKKLAPPGFRSGHPGKIFLALCIYPIMFYIGYSMPPEYDPFSKLLIERTFSILFLLSFIAVGFNYLNMQWMMPLCQHKNAFVHYLGILILDLFFSVLILFTMVFITNRFF